MDTLPSFDIRDKKWLIPELTRFLLACGDAGYATETFKVTEIDGSITYAKELDDWEKEDNYFGGEPFGGREVAFYRGHVVWMMVYYGEIVADHYQKETESYLRKVLSQKHAVWQPRGPTVYDTQDGKWKYANEYHGTIEKFHGADRILREGVEVYSCKYAGGLVNYHKD